MLAKVQICVSTASQLAGKDLNTFAEILPLVLSENGLPTISIPPEALAIAKKALEVTLRLSTPSNVNATPQPNRQPESSTPTSKRPVPTSREEDPSAPPLKRTRGERCTGSAKDPETDSESESSEDYWDSESESSEASKTKVHRKQNKQCIVVPEKAVTLDFF